MIIDLPKLGPVNFDDALTPDQFQSELERLSKKYEFEIPKSELTYGEQASRALTRGTKQLGSTFGDIIPAMGAKALGFDEYAQQQMGEAKRTEQEIEAKYSPQYKSLSDVKGPSDYLGFGIETFVENIPNIVTSLIPGVGLEAVAGRTALTGTAKALLAEATAKGLATDAAESYVMQGLQQAAPKIAQKAAIGQHAGVYLGSYAQNAPEVFQNIYDKTGEMAPGAAMLWGSAAAALDSVLPTTMLKSLTGPVKVGIVEKILEKSGMDKGLLRSITANVLKDAGYEGLTEGAQEAISISAENFVAKNPQVFDSKDWDRIIESSVRGAVAGGPFGGVTGATEAGRRQSQYNDAIQRRAGRTQAYQQAADLKAQADAAGMDIDQYQQAQAQGQLPGLETGPYSQLYNAEAIKKQTVEDAKAAKAAAKNAPKELTGTQLGLFNEQGEPTKQAEASVAKGEKILANQARDASKRLKKFLGSKQADLDLQPAPPTAGVEDQQQPDLFGAPPVAEPVIRAKPIKATPQDVAPKIDDSTFKALGIGPTATFVRNKLIHGKDISNPTDAAEVKTVLEAYADKTTSEKARNNVEQFLARPEFQAIPQETQNEPIAGASEPSVPSTEQAVLPSGPTPSATRPVNAGMGLSGEPNAQPIAGEQAVSAPLKEEPAEEKPLSKKDANDLAAMEENTPGLLLRQEREIKRNDLQTEKNLQSQVPEGIFVSPEESKDAHDALRLPSLFNTAFTLQDSINNPQDTKLGRAQLAREQEQLKQIEQSIAQSGLDAVKFYNALKNASPNDKAKGISVINKHGQNIFAEVVAKKVAEAKAREENDAKTAAIKKETKAQLQTLGKAHDVTKEMTYEERVAEANQRDIEALLELADNTEDPEVLSKIASKLKKLNRPVQKVELTAAEEARVNEVADKIFAAVKTGKVENLIDVAIETETNPEAKTILKKAKKLGLKTKVVSGKVVRKEGTVGAYNDVGMYDPVTDTITIDPKLGVNNHTAVHELVHAAISHVLRNPNHPLTIKLTALYNGIYSQLGSSYGAQDIQEFASELVSNPEFREALKGIKAPRGGNMLQRAIQYIAEFFGFRKGTSAYEAGIKTINDIFDIANDVGPSEGEQMFNIIGDARDVMPILGKKAVEDTKNYFSNIKGAGLASMGMGLLRLDHINKIWGKQLPAIQKLLDSLELRKGYQEAAIKRVKNNYSQFLKTVKKNPAAVNRMEDMAYDSRLAGVDPANPNFKPTPSSLAEYKRLRDVYNNLPAPVRQMYDTIRADYKRAFDDYKDFLIGSTDSVSLKNKIKAQFEANADVVAYIPFLRRGDYWVEYTDKATGERAASSFESIRERQQFIDSQLKGEEHKTYQNIESAGFNPNAIPSTSFLGQVLGNLSKNGASQQQLDSVYQSYLTLFPAHSISKQFLKSKNVRGMERDIVRGYGDTMLKWSRKLANTIYAPQIDGALEEIRQQAKNANDSSVTAAAQNILDQTSFMHNPTYSKFIHGATALSYFEYIAGNISSALVNLTSLPLLVYPILAGRFGYGKTWAAMLEAHKAAAAWVLKGDNKLGKYNGLYKMLQDHGQLEHTQARELLEGRRTSTESYTGLKARIEDGISMPFSATEKYNRAVTGIAAYDLAKSAGYSEEKALRFALDTVKDAHTSGMADTAPKWMQNPMGRVFFTFKSFAWNSAFIVARAFQQGFFEQTQIMKKAKAAGDMKTYQDAKDIRDTARSQLVGILAMTSAFAGVKGLPFMGLAEVVGQMLHALFGDDDEPYDFKEEMRAFFGEMIYKGPINYMTNLEISNRTGIAQDLIFRDDPRSIATNGYVLSAMKNAFGPAGSYLVNTEGAIKMFNEGHTERAIEALMPSFARNGMKGARYMTEGALTLKGDPVDEDVSAYNSLMQVIGFSPADLSSKYETTSAAKAYEKNVLDKKQSILNAYEMAQRGGDSDLMQDTRDRIAEFNTAHPGIRITGTTLQKSISARKAAERNTINGVTFNKKLLPEVKDKFFDED